MSEGENQNKQKSKPAVQLNVDDVHDTLSVIGEEGIAKMLGSIFTGENYKQKANIRQEDIEILNRAENYAWLIGSQPVSNYCADWYNSSRGVKGFAVEQVVSAVGKMKVDEKSGSDVEGEGV